MAADYSQIEMRIAAHFSENEQFRQVFADGADPFRSMASILFYRDSSSCVLDATAQRNEAKRLSYGWLYGQANDVDARANFERSFPGANNYHRKVRDELRYTGGVTTLSGNFRECNQATVAYNSKAQGSAADVFKVAVKAVHERLRRDVPKARIVLLVHDEIVLEVPTSEAKCVASIVAREMIGAGKTLNVGVPLDVTVASGRSYDRLSSVAVDVGGGPIARSPSSFSFSDPQQLWSSTRASSAR